MARPTTTPARQAEIAAALRRLLPRQGYAGASIKAIAAEAGLSPGLVHHHFGAKADILVRVVADLAAGLDARLAALPADAKPRARLRALVEAWLRPGAGADPEGVACWAAIGAEAARRPEVQAVYAPAVARQVARLAEALAAAAPGRDPARVRAVAVAVHAAIEGSFRLHASAPGLVPPGSAAPAVLALVDAWLDAP